MRPWIAILFVLVFVTAGVTPAQAAPSAASSSGTILINEVANGGSRSESDSFFELRNWGSDPVDLTGWSVYRCSEQGLRSNLGRTEGDLTGVILEPGGIYTVSKVGMEGDASITQPLSPLGFGLYLATPEGDRADSVAMYPNEPWPTQSECSTAGNLPNRLAFAFDESWQRIAATGNPARDFVIAPATLGAANARGATPAQTGVLIDEFASSGPAATDDEFVELVNSSSAAADISGWELYRCDARGRLNLSDRLATIAAGTVLAPGRRFVLAGHGYPRNADARYDGEFADVESGVLIRTAGGALADRVAVTSYSDSACQGDEKLEAAVDFVAAESYQRTAPVEGSAGWIIAPRTPAASNRTRSYALADQPFVYGARGVAISEIATDPALAQLPAGVDQRNYIEIANYGSASVDISGWTLRRCEASGIRSRTPQATVADGTVLEPGAAWIAARVGTPLASASNATYPHALNMLGAGVWLADSDGTRVDSVGIYAANEMDAPNVITSPCTKGAALTTYQPDRMLAETFQRTRFTGVDADDFVTAEATPGAIDELAWVDPTLRVEGAVSIPKRVVDVPALVDGDALRVLGTWSGVSAGPLTTLRGDRETRSSRPATAGGYDYPYQRLVLDAADLEAGSTVRWTGSSTARNEVQFSVWTGSAWRLLDAGSGATFQLAGVLEGSEIIDGRVTLLAQDGPRTTPRLAADPDGALQHPADYDLAVSHITDTQYLSESYPEVYAELVSWIADNAEARKVAFATHTGDLVQNWVDPAQNASRATIEFERASKIQGILDDAGVPNSVLPGNHDNKRGVDDDLFNEYFPPSRYESAPTYGGSIASDDNSANFSTFEKAGARFLMLSLPYAYGEREIDWASRVVTSHREYNVIISTHEHVTPKTDIEGAHRSANSRWLSRGQQLWDRVIAPNRNVGIVLSGHFHGIGQIRTENAGGIEGHDVVELLADYQEFRTHTGERATGFQRLLQIDLASSTVAVDTFSVRLDATASFDYDYPQFVPDTGLASSKSNVRPWNLVSAGVQGRYTAADDEFTASVSFQYAKRVATSSITLDEPVATQPEHEASAAWSFFGLAIS